MTGELIEAEKADMAGFLRLAGCDVENNGHSPNCRRCAEFWRELDLLVRKESVRELTETEIDRLAHKWVNVWRPGKRNQLVMGLAGCLVKNNVGIDSAEILVEKICVLAGDNERRARIDSLRRNYRLVENGTKQAENIAGISLLRKVLADE